MLSWTFVAAAVILSLLPPGIPPRVRTWVMAVGSLAAVATIWQAPVLPILGAALVVYAVGRVLPRLAPTPRQ